MIKLNEIPLRYMDLQLFTQKEKQNDNARILPLVLAEEEK